jgi:predicted membrane protein
MTRQQTSTRSLLSIIGAILLILGLALIFANLDALAVHVTNSFPAPTKNLGMLPALGLAGLSAVHFYLSDHSRFFSALLQFLVSFWPLLLVAAGALLMRRTLAGRSAVRGTVTGSSASVER